MLFGFSSNQGTEYKNKINLRDKKIKEGFTGISDEATAVTDARDQQFTQTTDDISRQLSELARAQQIANTETGNFLNVTTKNSRYLDRNVRLNDGTLGYVTRQGVFKRYNNDADYKATAGKNGCPSDFIPLDTGDSILTPNGKYLNGDVPLYIGTPMISGQQCGYAGSNIYVNSVDEGSKKPGKYIGCKAGDKRTSSGLIPTGLTVPTITPDCPAGTIQCGSTRGYCYDPKHDRMVSTYMVPEYDLPIGATPVQGKNKSFLSDDGVTYVWTRTNGFDTNCGTKPNFPPCPVGTVPCHSKQGHCYDPETNIMVTTINPNGGSSGSLAKPTFMSLVIGSEFTYNETNNPFVSSSNPNVPFEQLQFWVPDKQFTSSTKSSGNKIYEQFKSAAAQLMPHLSTGESSKLIVISKGNVISWRTQGVGSSAISGTVSVNSGWVFNNIKINNLYDKKGNFLSKLEIELRGDTVFLNAPNPSNTDSYTYYFKSPVEPIFRGNSSSVSYSVEGAEFTVTKISDTEASGKLKFGGNYLNTNYTFDNALPKYQDHTLSKDGNTKLWKVSDGHDTTCWTDAPQVPPLIEGDAIMNKCKKIAQEGGFGIYGIMNEECHVAKSVDTLQDGTNCQTFGSGFFAGTNSDFAAYELEGVKNSGLYRYGYVTADETLREYPKELQTVSDRFDLIGRKKIIRTPRFKTFTGEGTGVDGCQAKCINEYGNDCEAFNYEESTGNCTVYGLDSIKNGAIVPVGNSELLIRNKNLNNHSSCPKKFTPVNSSVWSALPKDGMMESGKMCGLGEITGSGRADLQEDINSLHGNFSNMNIQVQSDVDSNKQLQSSYVDSYDQLQQHMSNI